VQDGFIAAFLAIGNLRAPERFKSWLLGIVINLCRTRLRVRREGPSTTVWWAAIAASVSEDARRSG